LSPNCQLIDNFAILGGNFANRIGRIDIVIEEIGKRIASIHTFIGKVAYGIGNIGTMIENLVYLLTKGYTVHIIKQILVAILVIKTCILCGILLMRIGGILLVIIDSKQ